MSATGDTPGLTTTSSPTASRSTASPTASTTPVTSQPGHVRQRRLRQAPRDPQVHVVEGAGDDADAHVVGAELGRVDLAPAVGAGRLVQDPCVQRALLRCGRWRRRARRRRAASVRCPADGVDPQPERAVEVPRPLRRPRRADRRVRHVGAGRQPPPRLPAGPQAHRGGDLDDVDAPVVRVGPRGDVPPPVAVGVHHGDDRAPATRPNGGRGRRRGRRR